MSDLINIKILANNYISLRKTSRKARRFIIKTNKICFILLKTFSVLNFVCTLQIMRITITLTTFTIIKALRNLRRSQRNFRHLHTFSVVSATLMMTTMKWKLIKMITILIAFIQNAHIDTTIKETAKIERVLYDKYNVFSDISSRTMAFFHFDDICYEFVFRILISRKFSYAKSIFRFCHDCSSDI